MGIWTALALGLLCIFVYLRKVGSREAGLPPGPPTIPLLGNLHVFPTEFTHYKFTEWARKYGGIYSLKLGPGTAVVLTNAAAVKELMDKRSGSTVDRPAMHVVDRVTGGLNMGLARYNETWSTLRRTAHAVLTPQASVRHLPIQQAEASQLLHDILHQPEARPSHSVIPASFVTDNQAFFTHIRRYSNSTIMSVIYGKRAPRYETPETIAFFNVQHEWDAILEPGSTPPIDLIPILKYVPERWAKWKRDCARTRKLQRELYFGLLDETKERLSKGDENGSYMEEVLTRQEEFGMDREITGYLGGVLIDGGSDTTSFYLQSLILALAAYPDAQRKAHEEIDRVVGEHRMPTLDSLEEMPYIRAMIQETHRFRPIAPLMAPHCTVALEEYKGFVIPKGTTIYVNAWGIFHDPELFDDPENFFPDRYLLTEHGTKPGVDGSDLRPTLPFGVGRRICPGRHLAQHSINLNAMNLVWAFNFTADTDAGGNPIKLDTFDYERGILTGPRPFKCKITPRSKEKAEIIERAFADAGDTFSKFEVGLSPEDKEFVAKSRVRI
ncbi:putative cytochrome P450 [Mycena sanguinolenta]|uniref:Putative cytochrome P450 n=1 Tax=Mycena sanguinolenta TaxID=230812 RepID=A0A8H6WSS4_9AGAR|nr:putative cytochrome P450 [Mycena sanguinolenta]